MPIQSTEKIHVRNSFLIAALLIFILLLVFIVEQVLNVDFYYLGVYPRALKGVMGIITMVFKHSGLEHLFNNSVSLFVLTASLFYFYRHLSDKIFVLAWFFSGLLLWVIGRESWHVGASGLIYALAAFLCVSGFLRKHIPLVAIALLVVLFYGNMIWHVFPWQKHDPVSWEGHLAGGVVGIVLAVVYRKQGPQKPVKKWEEENLTEAELDFAEYAESFDLEGDEKIEHEEQETPNKYTNNGFQSSTQF